MFKKALLALALLTFPLSANAAWQAIWIEPANPNNPLDTSLGGPQTIYIDNATIQLGQGFWQADLYTDYSNRPQCVPSAQDCRWKKIREYATYQFYCNQTARLVADRNIYDEGPISESYNPQTHTYDQPPTYGPSTGPEVVGQIGAVYNFTGNQGLQYIEKSLCQRQ